MEPASNTLGLDFDQLKITESSSPPSNDVPVVDKGSESPDNDHAGKQEKKKPYVNPERVKTGGAQRDKLSEEALTERMARMKEQNEKIKQRRLDVMADEDAFKKTQESERIKQAHNRKVQANVDRTREQNAKRKMDKIQSREWDSGKPTADWKKKPEESPSATPEAAVDGGDSSFRGGRGGGRGRGRGRGGARQTSLTSPTTEAPPTTSSPAAVTTTTTNDAPPASAETST
ncbi:hypothetical protein BDZ89DRAFT_940427 [Hymenopellis radicata]|nr:hypothetical protein BDZ89DRAFT_940427 [Hymenopellis radicata]